MDTREKAAPGKSSAYHPKRIEDRWYRYWEANGFFEASRRADKPPHVIMMPPPNVTGALHMGHALQDTIQDVLTRIRRMQGYEALWMPGKDHAGIATQNVVERNLREERRQSRHDLGREAFVGQVWKWVDEYGGRILDQKRRLGDSCDWRRERFTMDEEYVEAVRHVFVKLYEDGLIYRGHYLVNWCPVDQTALSDEEVDNEERDGYLWHIRYPLAEGPGSIAIATTRPETMLGDTAVAVHPDDERYTHLVGKNVIVPLVERPVPVIADAYVRRDFGAGALKVTPGHDRNDALIGQRHDLPVLSVIDTDARINENGGRFAGLDRFEARRRIVDALRESGLLVKEEPYRVSVPVSQRSKAIIEPLLSRQWFVRMKPLAKPAIEAVRNGNIRFYPRRWENEYFRWLEEVRDWCISRQLWWGHRIPVWYHADASGEPDESRGFVVSVRQPSEGMVQDRDVLDTWFSSWLFPFATLGWPADDEETRSELAYFHPTRVLVSGYDILFFWIARMIISSLYVMREVPFRDVLITGMIKDRYGKWMSKSAGNGIDPLDMIEKYGADAVRYYLTVLCAQGQDIRLHADGFEGGRNFCNKIWNAFNVFGRFMEPGRQYRRRRSFGELELVEQWMLSRLNSCIEAVDADIGRYRLNEALVKVYSAFWGEFCDWYLELIKPQAGEPMAEDTVALAMDIYERLLQLLHPFMPFITEELWHRLRARAPSEACINSAWPRKDANRDEGACEVFSLIQEIVTGVRNVRNRYGVSPGRYIKATLNLPLEADRLAEALGNCTTYFRRLARIGDLAIGSGMARPGTSAAVVIRDIEVYLPLEGMMDLEMERARLRKEMDQKRAFLHRVQKKLSNARFLERAPAAVVERERQKERDAASEMERLQASLQEVMEGS